MKKKLYYIICLCSLVSIMLCACNNSVDSITETVTFQATVIEVTGNSILVEPIEGSSELSSSDQFSIPNKDGLELQTGNIIEIEYEGQTITITDMKDIGTIENILLNSKYDGEICDGINTHKIVLNNEVYYIKESCKEIQKGNKQATISTEDLSTIKSIIDNKINDEQD